MAEYNNIYVSLIRTTSADSVLDDNGVVTCNTSTGTGSISNPLNLRQFREYLRYDHGINQKYYLSGSASLDMYASSDKGLLGQSVLLETPHAGRTITITNWEDIELETNQPWNLVVGTTDDISPPLWIYTNNDDVEISNGGIQLSANFDRLSFGVKRLDATDKNILRLVNNKFFTNTNVYLTSEIHSFAFYNYSDILAVDNLFNNISSAGSVYVQNKSVGGCNFTSINNIYVRIGELIGFPSKYAWENLTNTTINFDEEKVNLNLDNSVFSYVRGSFTNSLGNDNYYNLLELDNECQYGWTVASACDEDLLTLGQSVDFIYTDPDWISITVSGSPTNNYNHLGDYNTNQYSFSKKRDGIGPLSFTQLIPSSISATTTLNDVGETVTFLNSNSTYDSTYNTSLYKWNFGDLNTSATSAGEVTHTYSYPEIFNTEAQVYSYNSWYYLNIYGSHRIMASSADYYTYLYVTSSDCFDEFFVSATTINIFDKVTLSAVNNSPYSTTIQIYDSWGSDFGGDYLNRTIYDDVKTGDFSVSGGTYSNEHMYISSGMYNVYFSTLQTDGKIVYNSIPVTVNKHTQNNYYVNLSENYNEDVWWSYNTVMYDTFESGIFDVGWGGDFNWFYSIVDMWEDKVASFVPPGGYVDGYPVSLFSNKLSYNFNHEFSFVRTGRDFKVALNIRTEMDAVLKVEWDYNNDTINVYYLNEAVRYIKYNLNDFGLTKDLRCSNSLRKLYIRIVNDPLEENDNGLGLNIYYSVDGERWIDSKIFSLDDNEYITKSYDKLILEAISNSETGFGYFKLQSKCGLPYSNGSESYALTYEQFKERVSVGGDGDYNDKYLLRDYRKLDELLVLDSNKFFEIDSWDMDVYGHWMMIFDIVVPETYDISEEISFIGSKISNGIIYNIKGNINGYIPYSPNLGLSFAYNMIVVWQGVVNSLGLGLIHIVPCVWMERRYQYKEFVGCTIKSELGFIDRIGS